MRRKHTQDPLIFQETPVVEFATNRFINVPVILQYDDTPLIEVVKRQPAGFTTKFRIYHSDGTHIAEVVGSRLIRTVAGAKANITLTQPPNKTVCELDGRTLFEIHRRQAAALKTEAELYAPDGCFLKARGNQMLSAILGGKEEPLRLGRGFVLNSTFHGADIGVHVKSDGTMAIAVGLGRPRS